MLDPFRQEHGLIFTSTVLACLAHSIHDIEQRKDNEQLSYFFAFLCFNKENLNIYPDARISELRYLFHKQEETSKYAFVTKHLTQWVEEADDVYLYSFKLKKKVSSTILILARTLILILSAAVHDSSKPPVHKQIIS